jgi:hypothetical protein
MNRNEIAAWLADTLGQSGEKAENLVYVSGRIAGLLPGQIRAAARELCVVRYQGARSVMWRLPSPPNGSTPIPAPMPPQIPEPHPRPRAGACVHI